MTKTDLLAGVKHTWYLHRPELTVDVGYTLLLLVAVLIAGGTLWVPAAVGLLAVVRTGFTIADRARDAATSRAFYEEFLANWNPEDAHQ